MSQSDHSATDHRLAKLRPRLHPNQDIQHRIAAAGLLHLKSFMTERARYFKMRNAESVHQMRVAIRRLRTVLYVLNRLTMSDQFLTLNISLRDFARVLGHGRDQDIFLSMLQQIPSSFFPDLERQEESVHAIIAIRDKAYLAIDSALQTPKLNSEFELLINIFQNRNIEFRPHLAARLDMDGLLLKDLLKSVMKKGRKIAENHLEERHDLRIALKRLRYALEFLALDRPETARRRAFNKMLETLLEHLGAGNDAFTAARIASDSLAEKNPHIHLMAGMIVGWHSRGVRDDEAHLMKAWQKFKSLKPYWD